MKYEKAPLANLQPATGDDLQEDDDVTGCSIRRTVAIGLKVFNVSKIDDVEQTCRISYSVEFKWWKRDDFQPNVKLLNVHDAASPRFELRADPSRQTPGAPTDLQGHLFRGCSNDINCSLDFRWFPFDVQYFPMHFRAMLSQDGERTGSFPLKPSRFLFGLQARHPPIRRSHMY